MNDTPNDRDRRVIYTCWPFAARRSLCGIALIGVGAAMLAQELLPGAPELVWGVLLLALGGYVLIDRDDG